MMPLLGNLYKKKRKNTTHSFTLIELLIVIAIIGILAALIIVSVTAASAKARDVKRQEDIRNIQKALEMYYTSNGNYPSTGGSASWWGNCAGFGSHPVSGSTGYVPSLAPTYIPSLPVDPRQGIDCTGAADTGACYIYTSEGTNYKLLAYKTVETTLPTATNALQNFWDPFRGVGAPGDVGAPDDCRYSLFTPGAKTW